MRIHLATVLAAFTAIFLAIPSARAATYQETDGTLRPIYSNAGVQLGELIPNFYNGTDLEPYAGLSGAFLQDAYLRDADLFASDSIAADLSVCEMSFANLSYALLVDTTLSDSTLYGADLRFAIATRADLSGVDLAYALLQRTNLLDADLRHANLTGVFWGNTAVSGALYDESTVFPSGNRISDGEPWGLENGLSPWSAGMILAPEPAASAMMLIGAGGVAGLARMRIRRRSRVAGRKWNRRMIGARDLPPARRSPDRF